MHFRVFTAGNGDEFPVIVVIDYMTLEYQPSPIVRGAFNWHLEFKWDHVLSYEIEGPEGPTTPIR